METSIPQTLKEIQEQILKTKTLDPHNYAKIQNLQQLLDKLMDNK
jgi:hypothetical protein